jgi:hypothetical protein
MRAASRLISTLAYDVKHQRRARHDTTLALEYEAVLKRETVRGAISTEEIDDFLAYFLNRALLLQVYFRWRPALPDPNDDCSLELAIRANAPIVTFNAGHFAGAGRLGVESNGSQGTFETRERPQMNLNIEVPDILYRRAAEIAAAENVAIEELFTGAVETRLLELDRLQQKAAGGSYDKFRRVMDKVPAVEPAEDDRI